MDGETHRNVLRTCEGPSNEEDRIRRIDHPIWNTIQEERAGTRHDPSVSPGQLYVDLSMLDMERLEKHPDGTKLFRALHACGAFDDVII